MRIKLCLLHWHWVWGDPFLNLWFVAPSSAHFFYFRHIAMHWLVLVLLKSLIVSSRLHQTSSGLIVVFCSSKAVTAMLRIIVGNCPGSELPMIRTKSQIPTHLASLFCAKIHVRAKMHVLLNSGSIALLNWSSAQSFWWLERTQRAKIPTPFAWEGLRRGSMPCSCIQNGSKRCHISKESKMERVHIDKGLERVHMWWKLARPQVLCRWYQCIERPSEPTPSNANEIH